MLFLIVCGWVVTSVLGYWLIRRDAARCGIPWLNKDAVLWSALSVLFGPAIAITGLMLLVCDLIIKINLKWFDRPSRW
jgi:hypothetical protein